MPHMSRRRGGRHAAVPPVSLQRQHRVRASGVFGRVAELPRALSHAQLRSVRHSLRLSEDL
eukprot:4079769-Prorocentrum_lima.AAC.1